MLVLTRYLRIRRCMHSLGDGCAAIHLCTGLVAESLSCGKRAITAVGEPLHMIPGTEVRAICSMCVLVNAGLSIKRTQTAVFWRESRRQMTGGSTGKSVQHCGNMLNANQQANQKIKKKKSRLQHAAVLEKVYSCSDIGS